MAFHYLDENDGEDSGSPDDLRNITFGFLNLTDKKELRTFKLQTRRTIIRWTNGGKSFDYYQTGQNTGKILRQDFKNKLAPPQIVFQTPQTRILHFDWSSDEKDLVITKASTQSDAILLDLNE